MGVKKRIESVVHIQQQNDVVSFNTIPDSIKRIRRLIAHETLVPVVCEDMFIYKNDETGEVQSLHSYIVETIILRYYERGVTLVFSEREIDDLLSDCYYGIGLLRSKIGHDIYEDIYDAIIDDEDNLISGVDVKPEVKEFLIAARFPLIITTTCFPILENIITGYTSYYNHIEERNDQPLPSKCIYHIFGEAKIEDPNWGYDDKLLLMFLKSSFSSEYSLKNLNLAIKSGTGRKTLMILGNSAPDWLFRFIITPIYGGNIYDNVKGLYMSMDNRDEDGGLNQFLKDIKFDKESQLIDVLSSVTKAIQTQTSNKVISIGSSKYDFFISHASEDTEEVRALVNHLRDRGLRVWVDYENLKDGRYWDRIIQALDQSRFFLPFITEKFILKNKKQKDLETILLSADIHNIELDSSLCIRMESVLDGVQIELLMAQKQLTIKKSDPYSIPIILSGSTLFLNPITPAYIRNCSEDSKLLPQSLFWGMQMYDFNPSDVASFKLEYDRYKPTNQTV